MAGPSPPISILESILNHVALPPHLPGRQEAALYKIEHALTERLLEASRTLKDLTNNRFGSDCVRRVIQTCKVLNAGGKLNKTSLLTAFRELEASDLVIHIREQNAGLIVRRHREYVSKIPLPAPLPI